MNNHYLHSLFNREKALFLLCCISVLCLCACSEKQVASETVNPYAAVTAMEETAIVDYVVPKYTPNILVNQKGYSTTGEKTAAVKGAKLPESFRLVDADSRQVVYTGEIEKVSFNEDLKLYVGFLDFGEYTQAGNYYLECDKVGRSLAFSLIDEIYADLFAENLQMLQESIDSQGTAVDTEEMIALLMAYEWYPDLFPDGDGDTVPDILKLVRGYIELQSRDDTLYAAFLAKFSYLYQKYDRKYATDCLKLASTYFEKNQGSLQTDADSFFTLTELYRATGLYTYRNQILSYSTYFENNTSYLDKKSYLYGTMTYMMTRQKVDVKLCSIFMENVMSRGEEIAARYMEIVHPITAKNNGCDDLLNDVVSLACANFIMNNYQYNKVQEEFWHYLMGKNKDSVCFYPEQGKESGYLFLLAQLAAVHTEEE